MPQRSAEVHQAQNRTVAKFGDPEWQEVGCPGARGQKRNLEVHGELIEPKMGQRAQIWDQEWPNKLPAWYGSTRWSETSLYAYVGIAGYSRRIIIG